MDNPRVVLIIINYNGRKHLAQCLDSVLAQSYKNFQAVVVDNNSSDGSIEFVRSNYPQIEVVACRKNLGYGKAINLAVKARLAKKDIHYFGILNNDIKLDRFWLEKIMAYSGENPGAGILSGKILLYHWPKYINSTGININYFGYGWDRDFFCPDSQTKRESGPVLAVTGSATLIKREVFESIGLYDQDYFLYYEDSDLCLRAWKYTDFTVDYVADAVIYHKFSASLGIFSPRKHFYIKRSRFLFVLKNFPLSFTARIFPKITRYEFKDFMGPLLYRLDFANFFRELHVYLVFGARFPFYVLKKLLSRRKARKSQWWQMLHPSYTKSATKNIDPEFVDIISGEGSLYGEDSHRIIMGINDRGLKKGWSNIINSIPRGRFAFGKASCRLKCDYTENKTYYMQIHYRNDRGSTSMSLSSANFSAHFPLGSGWNTRIIEMPGNAVDSGQIELNMAVREGSGYGDLFINEISVLAEDSNLLRAEL